jgi:hypothetical protein
MASFEQTRMLDERDRCRSGAHRRRSLVLRSVLIAVVSAASGSLLAQSPEFMMADCRNLSRLFFDDFDAQSDVKYEGQRADGSHYVNGTIFIADSAEHFQCSYASSGRRLLDFWAQDQSWPHFVVGGGGPNRGD